MNNGVNNQIITALLENGVKPSQQRILIYRYLCEKKNHPTADTIYTDLLPELPTLSRMTVYNTLNLLLERNMVQQIPMDGVELRYDADISEHAHFKCDACGRIFDIRFTPKIDRGALEDGFVVSSQKLFLWGTCPDCL